MVQIKTYPLHFRLLLLCILLPFILQGQSDVPLDTDITENQIEEPLAFAGGETDTLSFLRSQFPDASDEKLREYLKRLTTDSPSVEAQIARSKDINRFSKQYQTPTKFHNRELKIQTDKTIPYFPSKRLRDNIEVKGWHPYWLKEAHQAYPYSLMSTISYFSYEMDSTGKCMSGEMLEDWATTPLIDSAKANNCKVLLMVSNYGYQNNEIFLDNPEYQFTFIDDIITLLKLRDADGIDINFEGMPEAYEVKFVQFIKRVYTTFEQQNLGYSINLCLPVKDYSQVYNISALRKYVDKFSIFTYNYEYAQKHKKPLASLSMYGAEPTEADLSTSVDYYVDNGLSPSDLIVAFPYYGAIWTQEMNSIIPYEKIGTTFQGQVALFDSTTTSMYYRVEDSSGVKTCWFDNEQTLNVKYNWVLGNKLGGVGIFALGYDNNDPALWKLVENKFGQDSNQEALTPFLKQLKWRYKNAVGFTLFFALSSLGFFMLYFARNWKIQEILTRNLLLRLVFTSTFFTATILSFTYWSSLKNVFLLFGIGLFLGVISTIAITWLIKQVINRIP